MKTILIVDDIEMVSTMIAETLAPLNYQIIQAHSGEEAIEKAMITPPDLVVLDYNLKGSEITGEEVCVILRQSNPRLPIIVISGVADRQDISDVLRACATTFISKPYSPMYLMGLVEKYLREENETTD